MAQAYRDLTQDEIRNLEANGCRAADWSKVKVAEGFAPDRVRGATFSGEIRLGAFKQEVRLAGGFAHPSGIYHASLHDCTVANDCLVRNIGRHIAHYDIAAGAVIDHVGCMVVEGESAFGNGTMVEALNEGGGREVKIYDRLSSQVAYLLAVHRDRPELIGALERMIDAYVAGVTSARGHVGAGARVIDCGSLTNVRIGPAAVVEGATKLVNGSVNSDPEAPAVVGEGVVAEDFIFASGSSVTGGAMLTNAFIGQGSKVGRQYSGENVLLFANCEAFHGEGVAIFGGPYTVTHHKSTLLIAGMFSFYNAGSGSNQSNHMYKLGPVHQGVLERGSKTGSFSYMLWSCRVGAFSAVIGKHYNKFDTTDLPFSYIMESGGKSVIIPAFNFYTVGTRRDGAKWPKRDRRQGEDKLDLIHFEVLNPYTAGRILRGRELLRRLAAACPEDKPGVDYQGVHIPRKRLARGADSYDASLKLYLGSRIAARLEELGDRAKDPRAVLTTTVTADAEWLDLSGLLLPAGLAADLLDRLQSGKIADISELEKALRAAFDAYAEHEWAWVVDTWLRELGKQPEAVTTGDLARAVEEWRDAAVKANDLILKDAHKEFGDDVKIGFGLGGGADAVEADFAAVRGTFDDNSFVKELREDSESIKARAGRLLTLLN